MSNSATKPTPTQRRFPGDCRLGLLLVAVAVVLFDRLTKWMVTAHVDLGSVIPVIPHVFGISHVENPGAAFSLFDNANSPSHVRWLLFSFSILAIFVVLWMLWRIGRNWSATSLGLALILGGAAGNAYDRWRFGYVVDFLQVHIVRYHWPDFNVADSAIVIGGLLLLWESIRS